jgi:hypothetical protein
MKKINSLAIASLFVLSVASLNANTIVERFATNPSLDGWQVFGDTNLFHWDSTNQNLDVTWDSSQTNSYFYHPLGVTLTTNDSFCVQFDLQLNDAVAPGFGNEVAIGLLHLSDATNADFNRANGPTPNLFEFDYFPESESLYEGAPIPASVNATLLDSQPFFSGLYEVFAKFTLDPGVTYRIVLIHRVGQEIITGTVYTNGVVLSTLPLGFGNGTVGEFQLDALSVNCFTDDGFGDSVLAHGTVDNLAVASPLPLDRINTPAAGEIQFTSDTNWLYTLQKTVDFKTWTPAAPAVFGNGTNLVLQATNPPAGKAFYRVRADLP